MSRHLLPLAVFGGLLVLLGIGLHLDPRLVPSPLIERPAPAFRLSNLARPQEAVSADELRGQVTLLNVWASWCGVCRQEQPLLLGLRGDPRFALYGLDYKDERSDALRWLQTFGDPFVKTAFDDDGRTGIDYGVYGVPETYVIDRRGMIRYKLVGPLTEDVLKTTIFPLVERLRDERG